MATTDRHSERKPLIGRSGETGTHLPYENTAAGEDDSPVEHTYQTTDGREVTETIRAADATFVPNKKDGKIATPPEEFQEEAA